MTMKRIIGFLVFAAVIYAVGLVFLIMFQRNFLYFPNRIYRPPMVVEANEKLRELPVETEDGLNLKGWYAKAEGKPFTLVFFHGNADNLASVAPLADPYIKAGY
jgi:hypothetical protein